MGLDVKTLAAAKKYAKETATGGGAIQGKDGKDAPTISNITVDENNVLLTTLSDGMILNGGIIKTVQGEKGEKGDDGVSIPEGGRTGQILIKKSENDYDTEWTDVPSNSYEIIQGIL